jgi:UDP:flavonoid glycosyltransferase YjiC (YdhE family)
MASALRLLFIAQGVTLAHVVRPLVLARAMAARGHEAVLAAPARYRRWAPAGLQWRDLDALAPEVFAARVEQGRPIYKREELRRAVAQDLELITAVRPDVVVGDFRLSLAASARVAKVPYAALTNAYWSPRRPLKSPPPATPGLSLPWLTRLLYRAAGPWLLRRHAAPVADVLAEHGVRIGRDLRQAFTEADLRLHLDLPGLFPGLAETSDERFLGPLAWTPEVAPPAWWNDLPAAARVAYLTLGSSGETGQFHLIEQALVGTGYTVISATAGRAEARGRFSADFLPGDLACARSELVVCNGGSPQTTQALMAGRPVIGVCSNLDQFLNMQAVQDAGAGVMLRSDALSAGRLRSAIARAQAPSYAEAAQRLQTDAARYDPISRFEDLITAFGQRAISAPAPGAGKK